MSPFLQFPINAYFFDATQVAKAKAEEDANAKILLEEEAAKAAAVTKAQLEKEQALEVADKVISQMQQDQDETKKELMASANLNPDKPEQAPFKPQSIETSTKSISTERAISPPAKILRTKSNDSNVEDSAQQAAFRGCGCLVS